MTNQEWLACDAPDRMLTYLTEIYRMQFSEIPASCA
jgi:hypothetical protein